MRDGLWYVLMTGGALGFVGPYRIIPEFKAVDRIGAEGLEAFCPTVSHLQRERRGKRVRRRLVVPLWSGYVFARLDDHALSTRLHKWPEVVDVVRKGGQPYVLRDEIVASVRLIDQSIEYGDVTGSPKQISDAMLKPGDTVAPKLGAFRGVWGEVKEVDRDNIRFVIRLLGSERLVSAKRKDLELV